MGCLSRGLGGRRANNNDTFCQRAQAASGGVPSHLVFLLVLVAAIPVMRSHIPTMTHTTIIELSISNGCSALRSAFRKWFTHRTAAVVIRLPLFFLSCVSE